MPNPDPESLDKDFNLETFLPFILNQTAEATGRAFQTIYKERTELTRTQWRVLAIIGRYGRMTAKGISRITHEEKSKISRAVAALEERGILTRSPNPKDGRAEYLSLSRKGSSLHTELGNEALGFDAILRAALGDKESKHLITLLMSLKNYAETME